MKILKTILILIAALFLALSCGKEKLDPEGNKYEFITLRVDGTETRSDSLWFVKGTSGKLSIDQIPSATWSAKDSKIASITSDGHLTVTGCGMTELTARSESKICHFGLVVPDMDGNSFDIKGADFKVTDISYGAQDRLTITSTAIPAYVWNAVLSMEDHFYSYNYWSFTAGWNPRVSQENAVRFVSELNRLTGCLFRLPTHAEWIRYASAMKMTSKAFTSDNATGEETEIWLIKD